MRDAAPSPDMNRDDDGPDTTLHAIRSVLTDPEPLPVQRAARPSAQSETTLEKPAPRRVAAVPVSVRPVAQETVAPQPVQTERAPRQRQKSMAAEGLKDRIRGFRPKRAHVIGAVAVFVVVLRPQWVVLTVFALLFVILGAFALLGADRVWGGVMSALIRYKARHPERSEQLEARLDRFALRWDTFLDRFPEGSVDGLYLPDLQALQQRDDAHDAAVGDRLSRMQAEA